MDRNRRSSFVLTLLRIAPRTFPNFYDRLTHKSSGNWYQLVVDRANAAVKPNSKQTGGDRSGFRKGSVWVPSGVSHAFTDLAGVCLLHHFVGSLGRAKAVMDTLNESSDDEIRCLDGWPDFGPKVQQIRMYFAPGLLCRCISSCCRRRRCRPCLENSRIHDGS